MGEGFDNFKSRVSNVKNQAISASTEALSNKVRNFSDAIETGRQNIHNTLDSLGNKNRPAFVTVDDIPVDLPKSKVSSKMDDLADRIQQISVEHKQKIEAFEGRGGGSRNVSTPHSDASSLETSNWGSDALSDLRKKWNVPETDTIAVGKTDIPGLEDRVFEGGSPKVRKEAGLPDLDEAFPDRTVRSPFNNPRARNHAEEGIFAQFEEAVQHMDPEKVKGTLEMHQSNPSGVCTSCISGITNDAAKEGIFLQFSKKYPDLKIMVTSVEREGVRKVGRLNFTIQNGKYLK